MQCGPDARREGNQKTRFTKIELLNGNNEMCTEFSVDEQLKINMEYESDVSNEEANFVIGITREDWVYCYGTTVKNVDGKYVKLQEKGKVSFSIPELKLLEGRYFIDLRIQNKEDVAYDCIYSLLVFEIKKPERRNELGILRMDCMWREE